MWRSQLQLSNMNRNVLYSCAFKVRGVIIKTFCCCVYIWNAWVPLNFLNSAWLRQVRLVSQICRVSQVCRVSPGVSCVASVPCVTSVWCVTSVSCVASVPCVASVSCVACVQCVTSVPCGRRCDWSNGWPDATNTCHVTARDSTWLSEHQVTQATARRMRARMAAAFMSGSCVYKWQLLVRVAAVCTRGSCVYEWQLRVQVTAACKSGSCVHD